MANLTQTAANVSVASGAVVRTDTAGATIVAGNPIYKDSSTSTMKLSRANAVGTALCNGIAINSASSGQPVSYVESTSVGINLGATLVLGETYVVSDSAAGAIMPVGDLGTGDYPVILGTAISTSLLKLSIITAGVAKA